jgi:hypothetical protein
MLIARWPLSEEESDSADQMSAVLVEKKRSPPMFASTTFRDD